MRPKPTTPTRDRAPLTPCLAAILLHGASAGPPDGCDAEEHTRAVWYAYWHDFSVLWTQHEAQLRAFATQWQWVELPTYRDDEAPGYWGEYFAREQARYGTIV